MNWKPFVVCWTLALTLLLFAQRRPSSSDPRLYSSMIDLSHPVASVQEPVPHLQNTSATVAKNAVVADDLETRMDAPAQFVHGLWSVDKIPAERLIRPLVVLNVRDKVRRDPDYRVSIQDIADFEDANGRIPLGSVVAVYTGWDDRWNSSSLYLNASADKTPHYPGFTLEAARFLVEARQALALGIDTASTDGGNSTSLSVHRYCAERSVYQLENLTGLGHTPQIGTVAVATPLKLENAAAAPARVFSLKK